MLPTHPIIFVGKYEKRAAGMKKKGMYKANCVFRSDAKKNRGTCAGDE